MKKQASRVIIALIFFFACCACLVALCSDERDQGTAGISDAGSPLSGGRGSRDIIRDICRCRSGGGTGRDMDTLFAELDSADHSLAVRWERIMELWRTDGTAPELNYDVLPDGLDNTGAMCIVVLGYQLERTGGMSGELIGRLGVALKSAEKYPEAYIVCTGGGTAALAPSATEAGRMAEWLIENGVDSRRVIAEDRSLSTVQNAEYTFDILTEKYPQVTQLAIVSSDYHIASGMLLFGAESMLRAEKPGDEKLRVVSNAAYRAPSGSLTLTFQAEALAELYDRAESAGNIP